jgi:hypothetical protein
MRHFRYESKHIALLMQLQIEVPALDLVAVGQDGKPMIVQPARLNLDYEELRFLNPASAA